MSTESRPKTELEVANAKSFARSIIGDDAATHLGSDVLETVAYELTRREEIASPDRDEYGNWSSQFSASAKDGRLYSPWLDELIGAKPDPTRWPQGKPFALVLSHDVDRISHAALSTRAYIQRLRCATAPDNGSKATVVSAVKATARFVGQLPMMGGSMDRLWHYNHWCELEDRFGFRSSWFFFADNVRNISRWDCQYQYSDRIVFGGKTMRLSDVMKTMSVGGWDVGLHGSFFTPTDLELLREQRERVEQATAKPVTTTRQHYLHYDSAKTPQIHEAAGFEADSTMGFNRDIGFRCGTSFPFFNWNWETSAPTNVLQVPQIVMDCALFRENSLKYGRVEAVRHVVEIMQRVAAVGGCMTLSFHPEYINEYDYWHTYSDVLAEAKKMNAWGCSVSDVNRWWRDNHIK